MSMDVDSQQHHDQIQHAPELDEPGPRVGTRTTSRLRRLLAVHRLSGIYAWLGLVVLFSLWVPETFLTDTTARSIGTSSSVTAIIALALVIPLACGLFDLSVAGTLSVAAVLSLELQSRGMPMLAAILIVILAGALIGAVNGVLVVKAQVSSFIATLGMSSILAAAAFWVTDGVQVVAEPGSRFVAIGQSVFLGIPFPVWCAVVVALVLFYITETTTTGRYLYAIGGNADAARLVGIRIDRYRLAALVGSGVTAAVGGIVLSAQLGASSDSIGPPYLLPAFSAVLLGATQVKVNGRVNVLGTLVAVILLATGIFGLQLAGAPAFISNLFNGTALIVAVALSVRANSGRAHSATPS